MYNYYLYYTSNNIQNTNIKQVIKNLFEHNIITFIYFYKIQFYL